MCTNQSQRVLLNRLCIRTHVFVRLRSVFNQFNYTTILSFQLQKEQRRIYASACQGISKIKNMVTGNHQDPLNLSFGCACINLKPCALQWIGEKVIHVSKLSPKMR